MGRGKRILGFIVFAMTALLVAFASGVGAETDGAASSDDVLALFLPMLSVPGEPESTILGTVREDGDPVQGAAVELRYYDGSSWSTLMGAVTKTDGSYSFEEVPPLGAGQKYRVYYLNLDDPTRLSAWRTRELSSFGPGDWVNMGNFDIANVELLEPEGGMSVTLPVTFRWVLRDTTSDSYEFNLFDSVTRDPYFYTDPPLGYVDNYVLSALPPGFNFGSNYVWNIWIYGPNSGQGISYWANFVLFEEGGQRAPGSSDGMASLGAATWFEDPESLFDR